MAAPMLRMRKINYQNVDKLKYHFPKPRCQASCGKIFTDGIQCQGIEVLAHLKHRPKVRGAALSTAPACGIGSSWISCDDEYLREVTDWSMYQSVGLAVL